MIRRFTRNRKINPNEESVLKIVYRAIHEASRRWTLPHLPLQEALDHFVIAYEGRLPHTTGK